MPNLRLTESRVEALKPLTVTARLLGHSDVRMTVRYAHVGDNEVEAAAERVGVTIATIMAGYCRKPEILHRTQPPARAADARETAWAPAGRRQRQPRTGFAFTSCRRAHHRARISANPPKKRQADCAEGLRSFIGLRGRSTLVRNGIRAMWHSCACSARRMPERRDREFAPGGGEGRPP